MTAPDLVAPSTSASELAALEARLAAVEAGLGELRDSRRFGWKAIARGLRCDEKTARGYARRQEDRLPVTHDAAGRVWIWESALRDWANRHELPYKAAKRLQELEREVEQLRASLAAIGRGETPSPETAREGSGRNRRRCDHPCTTVATTTIRRPAEISRRLPSPDQYPTKTSTEQR